MEQSKFIRFCRVQNLRIMFHEAHLPPELLSLISFYEKRFQMNINGTLLEDYDPALEQDETKRGNFNVGAKNTDKDRDKRYAAVLQSWMSNPSSPPAVTGKGDSPKATILAYIERNGRRFQSGESSNGYVIFQQHDSLCYSPGRIVSILSLLGPGSTNQSIYLLIRRYQTLSEEHTALDPYRQISHCGYLVYDNLEPEYSIVPISDIVTHFAYTKRSLFQTECIHVLPL